MTHLSYRLTWPNLIHLTYWVQSHLGTYEYVWILYHTINLRKKKLCQHKSYYENERWNQGEERRREERGLGHYHSKTIKRQTNARFLQNSTGIDLLFYLFLCQKRNQEVPTTSTKEKKNSNWNKLKKKD